MEELQHLNVTSLTKGLFLLFDDLEPKDNSETLLEKIQSMTKGASSVFAAYLTHLDLKTFQAEVKTARGEYKTCLEQVYGSSVVLKNKRLIDQYVYAETAAKTLIKKKNWIKEGVDWIEEFEALRSYFVTKCIPRILEKVFLKQDQELMKLPRTDSDKLGTFVKKIDSMTPKEMLEIATVSKKKGYTFLALATSLWLGCKSTFMDTKTLFQDNEKARCRFVAPDSPLPSFIFKKGKDVLGKSTFKHCVLIAEKDVPTELKEAFKRKLASITPAVENLESLEDLQHALDDFVTSAENGMDEEHINDFRELSKLFTKMSITQRKELLRAGWQLLEDGNQSPESPNVRDLDTTEEEQPNEEDATGDKNKRKHDSKIPEKSLVNNQTDALATDTDSKVNQENEDEPHKKRAKRINSTQWSWLSDTTCN